MNEEAKEMPQSPAPEAAPQQSAEVAPSTESQAEKPQSETSDKSVTEKRHWWQKLFNKKTATGVATGAAVAAGIALAPTASAESQENPPTSISQEDAPKVTEEEGHVVKVETDNFDIEKVDKDKVNIDGNLDLYGKESGIDALKKEGIDVKDADINDATSPTSLDIKVDDADKLDRIKDAPINPDTGIGTEDGQVVKVEKDNYSIAQVDEDTVNIVSHAGGITEAKSEGISPDSKYEGLDELKKKDIQVQRTHNDAPTTLQVDIDDASKLDNMVEKEEE